MSTGTIQQNAAGSDWGTPVAQQGLPSDWASRTVDPLADIDGFDTEQEGVKLGGERIDAEGVYHFEVRNAEFPRDEHGNQKLNRNNRRYINVHLVVLNTVPGQSPAGASMWHEIEIPNPEDREQATKNGGTWFAVVMSSLCSFCVGCGIFAKRKGQDGNEQIIDLASGSTKLQLSTVPERLKGLQVIGRPKKRTWAANPEKGTQAGWTMEFPYGSGVSQIADPQNASVPMMEAALTAGGYKRFQQPQQQQPQKPQQQPQQAPAVRQPATQVVQQPATTAPSAEQFDDL